MDIIYIYVFETSNSDTENGFKEIKMSPEKNSAQRKLENWKRYFMKYTRITQSHGYLIFREKYFLTIFYFQTSFLFK